MFCKNCGRELPEDAKFCVQCGASMKQKAESTEKATETDTSNAEGSQAIGASSIVKKEWFPWAIVLLLVVIVGILAVALGTTKMGNQNNVEPNNENIAEVQDLSLIHISEPTRH